MGPLLTELATGMWGIWIELAPWLLVGAAIAAAMHVFLPADLMRRQFTGPGGVFKAVLFGVPLPLCSCGVIPTGLGLKKDGASDGAAVGFLISTPQTGVDSILVSATFLGWPFALFKVAAAAVTGVVGGLWADRVGSDGGGAVEQAAAETGRRGWAAGWAHARQLLSTIAGWVVFGVFLSALITTLIPPSAFAALEAYGAWVPFVGVLALSVPLYVCATASVPIAAALVTAGLTPGAALVFLMAGPATNVATIGAIYRGFGKRVLGVYLVTIILGSAGLGYVFDAVIDPAVVAKAVAHHHEAWWATAAGVALAILFAWFGVEAVGRAWSARRVRAAEKQVVLDVDGITCGGCARKVEKALRDVPGVDDVAVTVEPGQATVMGRASLDEMVGALAEAGYPARAHSG